MTFSQDNQEEKKDNYFLSQVHQPFFTLGVLNAIVMMLIFALSYKGVINLSIDLPIFHVYSLVFVVFTNIFTGFLFTTYPRFCGEEPVEKSYYLKVFYINLTGSILFTIGIFTSLILVLVSMIIIAFGHYKIFYKLREMFDKSEAATLEDPFWILRAFKFGLYANIMMIISTLAPQLTNFAILYSFFMFLIFLTFTVAQRMIPFFSHSMQEKDERFVGTVFILFFIKTILNTFNHYEYVKMAEILLDVLIGMYLLGEFLAWKILDKNAHAILWVLHLGVFWLPTAFLVDAIALVGELVLDTNFVFLGIHLIAIGFLTTILIGFGTRVTYGHSGQPPQANGFVKSLFIFVQFVVIARLLYSINIGFGWEKDFLFDISFSTWLLLFTLWSIKFLPLLIRGKKIGRAHV